METFDLGKIPIQFGSLVSPLFGWFHPPRGARRSGGIVICNPVGDDLVRAHRPLRHLAERLAAAGFPVLRFDYRGTGDSAGDESEPGRVAGWLADVSAAADELRARGGVERLAFVGLRAGATLAVEAASDRDDVAAVVSWSGYPTGGAFVDDALRTHRMHRKLEPEAFSGGPPAPGGEEALGFFLSDETMAGLREIDLAAAAVPRVLVLATGEKDAVSAALECAGVPVERRQIPADRFLIVPPHQGPLPEEALAASVPWLEATFPDRTEVPAPPPRPARVAPLAGEEPHVIPGPRPLFGILTRPVAPRPGLPAIVLVNAGCVPRFGPHRQYLPLARRWAALGFSVLRLDLSGIGDSPVGEGAEENVTYPPGALDDLGRALDWLEGEARAERFVLAGLCSGADIAFTAGRDPRVAGLVMMNPRTFCVYDLGMVESFKGARWYQESLHRKDAWKKLLRGQVNLVRVARAVGPKAMRMLGRKVKALVTRDAGAEGVPGRLRALAERGVDTLVVVAPHDPGIDYVDANFAGEMRTLRSVPGFRREDIEGTDHTFTALWAQRRMADLLTEHLVARHLPAAMPAPQVAPAPSDAAVSA
jgi:dienelactone hydrolase